MLTRSLFILLLFSAPAILMVPDVHAQGNAQANDGARVQGIFVSLDPDRDTGALLKSYAENFGPGIIGLRGTSEQTKAAAREFKVFYSKVPGQTATSYTVDHTAGSYIFDAKGRVRLFTRYGGGAKALADDLKILLAESPA